MSGPLPSGDWTDLLHLGSTYNDRIQNGEAGTDYLGGESSIMPAPGTTVADIPGATENPMVWTPMHDDDGNWQPNLDGYVMYWHIYVISPDEREVRFHFGHDDDLYVWNNGVKIIDRPGWDGGSDQMEEATLAAGVNSITIKLWEGSGGDRMKIRVTDLNDQPFSDLTYTLTPGTVIGRFAVTDRTSGSDFFTDEATINVALTAYPGAGTTIVG